MMTASPMSTGKARAMRMGWKLKIPDVSLLPSSGPAAGVNLSPPRKPTHVQIRTNTIPCSPRASQEIALGGGGPIHQ